MITKELKIASDSLEVQIHFVRKEDANNFINQRTDSTFIYNDQDGEITTRVTVPTYRLFSLAESLPNWDELTWMCI